MNAYSYGIVCYKGSLAFCHNGQVSPIMPLSDLPISIRLSVLFRPKGIVLCYALLLNASAGAVHGRRVITLADNVKMDPFKTDTNNTLSSLASSAVESGSRHQDDSSHSQEELFPVFTVTQRVKMQFPLTSDV